MPAAIGNAFVKRSVGWGPSGIVTSGGDRGMMTLFHRPACPSRHSAARRIGMGTTAM